MNALSWVFSGLSRAAINASVNHPRNRQRPFGKTDLMSRCMKDLAPYHSAASSGTHRDQASSTGARPKVPGSARRPSPASTGGREPQGGGGRSPPQGAGTHDRQGRDHRSSPQRHEERGVHGRDHRSSPQRHEERGVHGRDHRSSPPPLERCEVPGRNRRSSPHRDAKNVKYAGATIGRTRHPSKNVRHKGLPDRPRTGTGRAAAS